MGKKNSMLKKKKKESGQKKKKVRSDFSFKLGGGVLTFL